MRSKLRGEGWKVFSLEEIVIASMRAVTEFVEMCGYHSEEATDSCRSVVKKENENCNGDWFQRRMIIVQLLMNSRQGLQKEESFSWCQMDASFLIFLPSNTWLCYYGFFPEQRSWEFDNNLPSGWQVKTKFTWQFKTGVSSRPSGGPARSKSREGGWKSSPRLVDGTGRGGSRPPLFKRIRARGQAPVESHCFGFRKRKRRRQKLMKF